MSNIDFSFLILGAGKPHKGDVPAAMGELRIGKSVLSWMIEAAGCDLSKITFIAGYQSELIKKNFPDLQVVKNNQWSNTSSGYSLSLPKLNPEEPLLIGYSDVLFRNELVERLSNVNADVVVAFDSKWRSRFSGSNARELDNREKVIVQGSKIERAGRSIPTKWADGEFIG